MQTLYLTNDLTGCSELCSLFLHPDHRIGTNGKLLSKSRLLFIAQFPHLFNEKLIAELRGYQRPDGSSPFWDSLGRHFFQMDFSRADSLVSISGKKSFIADLMPRHPLYAAYLPKEAQDAIGQVHVDTEPARRLLEEEGFFFEGYVDIFDAGPVMQARVSKLRSSRRSELVEVLDVAKRNNTLIKEPTLVANTNILDYRIMLSDVAPENGKLSLTTEQKQVMSCSAHSHVRVMSLNP
jgi:arginine N-succinyltransferase